jgi:Protein of unknown function (DUF3379)
VTCAEARLLIGADPGGTTTALEEHLRGCAACAGLRQEMRALDDDIRRALEHPPDLVRSRSRTAPPAWRQWALAASVALAAFLGLAVWLLRPSDTLAREVVAHVESEPESWLATQQVTAAGIDHALRGAGVTLDITSDRITYAQSCWFRGHYVPHLVLQTAHGPATVLILRHEQVPGRRAFHEAGMSGVIVPAERGSIAVLERGGGDIDDIARAMQRDVHWLPGSS